MLCFLEGLFLGVVVVVAVLVGVAVVGAAVAVFAVVSVVVVVAAVVDVVANTVLLVVSLYVFAHMCHSAYVEVTGHVAGIVCSFLSC